MNMAVDEAILTCQSQGKVPPTIRFYQWQPPAITIGYFQRINEEVDMEACRESGIDVVRRLTGGRAVLHHRELTYSLVACENDPHVPGGVLSSYLAISKGLLAGLKKLGLEGKVVEGGAERSKGTAACFDAPSWYEITIDGKKVIGSAQTRKYGSLLQHGSVPVILEAAEVCRCLRFPSDKMKEYTLRRLKEKAAGLAQFFGGYGPPLSSIEKAFFDGFAEGLGVHLAAEELTPEEKDLARHLCRNKYRQDHWNFKR